MAGSPGVYLMKAADVNNIENEFLNEFKFT